MGHEGIINPNPWSLLPFGVLLGAIALAPLWAHAWWGRHYPKVAFGLAAITLTYYLGGCTRRRGCCTWGRSM
ncbi:MAG: sodium:proton antiporter [Verrucomicrobia bacterium]|nr:sodium:proton antiporter [Verrucomicrobiota bacterium]